MVNKLKLFKNFFFKKYRYQVIDSRTLTNFWGILERESKKGPFWIQCSKPNCLKWRKLESIENLPEDVQKFFIFFIIIYFN